MPAERTNAAEDAANAAQEELYRLIDRRKSFRLEAGAGAGKTYSLVNALRHLTGKFGRHMIRDSQRIACLTYTNVATDEIASRIDGHPAVFVGTLHSFAWDMIRDAQAALKTELGDMGRLSEKIEVAGGISGRSVAYDQSGQRVSDEQIYLGHDDVITLFCRLLANKKFRMLLTDRFPVVLVDEYQDTDALMVRALATHFLDTAEGPVFGFFGDHWQKIYGEGCGLLEHVNVHEVKKGANFRSAGAIVEALNRIRPQLPQAWASGETGHVRVFHTNGRNSPRRTGAHWAGDLEDAEALACFDQAKALLSEDGWDMATDKTKVLMLTHGALAKQMGYSKLAKAFTDAGLRSEAFAKKEDKYVAFFADVLEPACDHYSRREFGAMLSVLGRRSKGISDKQGWKVTMDRLMELRSTGTIGDVVDFLSAADQITLPSSIRRKEQAFRGLSPVEALETSGLRHLAALRTVAYSEMAALTEFVRDHSPFATKHGVKGAEFENVLGVFGRGWSSYNFGKMLGWLYTEVPADKAEEFERNRNLFYVVCSRPKARLALLFTQKLEQDALAALERIFGSGNIQSI